LPSILGVVYHHGIGLDTSRYDYLTPRSTDGGTMRMLGNYLVAASIRIPH
jgi:hypothetical protein